MNDLLRYVFSSVILAGLLSVAPLAQDKDSLSNKAYFAGIGAGRAGQVAFRTEFVFINSEATSLDGLVEFLNAEGTPLSFDLSREWNGLTGRYESSGERVIFEVPPGSSLILTLNPEEGGQLAWARFFSEPGLLVRSVLQIARISSKTTIPFFEDDLDQISEVEPVEPLKRFSIPIGLYSGHTQISTAFSLLNLSGAPGLVRLIYRDGLGGTPFEETVQLRPGQLIAKPFDQFWGIGFPEIFPLKVTALAEIESALPLATAVFTTVDGSPESGIKPVPLQLRHQPVPAQLGSEIELAVNDQAVFEDPLLEILFWDVIADSRCPTDGLILCVWEGELVVELKVQSNFRSPAVIRLSTDGDKRFGRIGPYQVELKGVAPPASSTEEILITDYRIKLLLTQNDQGQF